MTDLTPYPPSLRGQGGSDTGLPPFPIRAGAGGGVSPDGLVFRPRWAPISLRLDVRVPLVIVGLLVVIVVGLIVTVGRGDFYIAPLDVVKAAFRLGPIPRDHDFIVNTLRLPRALVALLVGMGLATAGAIMQGLTRNPLADPGITGVNAGASLAAVTLIVLIPNAAVWSLPLASFAGALVVAILIYTLAWVRGGSAPLRLILVGMGLSTILGAATTLMITFGNINQVQRAMVWLAGSVYGRSWEHLWPLVPWIVVGLGVTLAATSHLNVLNLGDEVATGLGAPVERHRLLLLLTAVALAGASVATAGTIGFVGLIAPHIARRLVGPNHAGLIPTAALTGAALMIIADAIGRLALAPIEIPCGIITAIIGAPYFMYLLYRGRR